MIDELPGTRRSAATEPGAPSYCAECGARISADAPWCGLCTAAVLQPASAPMNIAPEPDIEELLSVPEHLRRLGLRDRVRTWSRRDFGWVAVLLSTAVLVLVGVTVVMAVQLPRAGGEQPVGRADPLRGVPSVPATP